MVGERFGLWTVAEEPKMVAFSDARRKAVLCQCDCGRLKYLRLDILISGKSKQCRSCSRKGKPTHFTHNESNTKLYDIWIHIKDRCNNPKYHSYERYGGRGISVCDSWLVSYESFASWSKGNGYREGLQIDRIDNNGPYSPKNCRWTTVSVNCRNTRRNNIVDAFGETKCLMDWAEDPRCKVGYGTLSDRIRSGWNREKAITTTPQKRV